MFGSPWRAAQEWEQGSFLEGAAWTLFSLKSGCSLVAPAIIVAFAAWPALRSSLSARRDGADIGDQSPLRPLWSSFACEPGGGRVMAHATRCQSCRCCLYPSASAARPETLANAIHAIWDHCNLRAVCCYQRRRCNAVLEILGFQSALCCVTRVSYPSPALLIAASVLDFCCAALSSLLAESRIFRKLHCMSAIGQAGHNYRIAKWPLMTQSGHAPCKFTWLLVQPFGGVGGQEGSCQMPQATCRPRRA